MSLLSDIKEEIDTIIVEGYVFLGERPGLEAYLRNAISAEIKVIGVAKSYFAGSSAAEVYRGKSRRPLYVSSAGLDQTQAAKQIASMHGDNRIPTLLKEVDRLTKDQ